jgi:hypothetical protein
LEKLEKCLESFPGLESLQKTGNSMFVALKPDFGSAEINDYCFKHGIVLKKLVTLTNSLEKEFLKILKEHD